MTAKFTPGPWILEDLFIYKLHEQTGASGRPFITNVFSVAVQGNGTHGAQRDELEANARLIAAAPDMYETLQSIAGSEVVPPAFRQIAQQAIAKAEGRT